MTFSDPSTFSLPITILLASLILLQGFNSMIDHLPQVNVPPCSTLYPLLICLENTSHSRQQLSTMQCLQNYTVKSIFGALDACM